MDPSAPASALTPEQWADISAALVTFSDWAPYVATVLSLGLVVGLISMVVGWTK